MRFRLRIGLALSGVIGLASLAVGIVYLTVACQDLPGILGPTRGDTAPRTVLGIVGVSLGLLILLSALLAARRRGPGSPLHS